MVEIPNPNDMRRRQVTGRRVVARTDTSNADYGASHLAGTLSNIADRETQSQIAQARTEFLARKAEQDRAYDQDDDHTTIARRYEESMREAAMTAGANISIGRARREFLNAVEVDLERGKQNMESLAHSKHRDQFRARTNEQLNSLQQVAINGDDADMAAANETMAQVMEAGVEAGFYTHEDAGKIRRAWRNNVSAERLRTMDAEQALAQLDLPWTQNLPPNVRREIREQAEQDRETNQAQTIADDIWAASIGEDGEVSYDKALAQIRSIEDVDMRRAVQANVNALKGQDDAARAEDLDRAHEEGLQVIVDGGRFSDIPASVRNRMGAAKAYDLQEKDRRRQEQQLRMRSLSAQEKANLETIVRTNKNFLDGARAANPEVYLSGPEEWSGRMLQAYQGLPADDQAAIDKDIAERKAKGGEVSTVDKLFKDGLASLQFYLPDGAEGIDIESPEDSSGSQGDGGVFGFGATSNEEIAAAAQSEYYQLMRDHSERTGGTPPTDQEQRAMVSKALARANPDLFGFNAFKGIMRTKDIVLNKVALREEAADFLRSEYGREPTPEEIQYVLEQMEGE